MSDVCEVVLDMEDMTYNERCEAWRARRKWCVDNVGPAEVIIVNEFGDTMESEFAGKGWEIWTTSGKWILWFDDARHATIYLLTWT